MWHKNIIWYDTTHRSKGNSKILWHQPSSYVFFLNSILKYSMTKASRGLSMIHQSVLLNYTHSFVKSVILKCKYSTRICWVYCFDVTRVWWFKVSLSPLSHQPPPFVPFCLCRDCLSLELPPLCCSAWSEDVPSSREHIFFGGTLSLWLLCCNFLKETLKLCSITGQWQVWGGEEDLSQHLWPSPRDLAALLEQYVCPHNQDPPPHT